MNPKTLIVNSIFFLFVFFFDQKTQKLDKEQPNKKRTQKMPSPFNGEEQHGCGEKG